jgi:hypothetical protein
MNAAAKKLIIIPIVFFVLSAQTIAQTPKAKPPLLSCDVNVDCKNKDDALMKMRMSWMQINASSDPSVKAYAGACFDALQTVQKTNFRTPQQDLPTFLKMCNIGLQRMQ